MLLTLSVPTMTSFKKYTDSVAAIYAKQSSPAKMQNSGFCRTSFRATFQAFHEALTRADVFDPSTAWKNLWMSNSALVKTLQLQQKTLGCWFRKVLDAWTRQTNPWNHRKPSNHWFARTRTVILGHENSSIDPWLVQTNGLIQQLTCVSIHFAWKNENRSFFALPIHAWFAPTGCEKEGRENPLQVSAKDLCKLTPLWTYRKPPALIGDMMPVPSYAKQNDHYQDCVFGSNIELIAKRSKHHANSSASWSAGACKPLGKEAHHCELSTLSFEGTGNASMLHK